MQTIFRLLMDRRDKDALGYDPCSLGKDKRGLASPWSSRSPKLPILSLGTRG